MVQFGHLLLTHQVPGWESYYLNYKELKKTIKVYEGRARIAPEEEQDHIIKIFSELLDSQVEKMVLFFLERQGLLAAHLQRLRERRLSMQTAGESVSVPDLMEDYRDVGRELLQLLQFMEMNATGIRKILKKFDRRVGLHLGEKYLETRTKHPYSQLQQVFRQVGLGAILGTLMRNLGELHLELIAQGPGSQRMSTFNLFARSQVPLYLVDEEPVIKEIQAAQQKLTNAVTFNTFVANELLLPKPSKLVVDGDVEFHWWSLQLNQINTFLYMVNYYIIVPTSDDYAEILKAPGSLSGVIIGSMPFCALISSLVYSKWSNHSYQEPLYVSTIVLILGNVMYATAYDFNAVWLLMAGRALAGLGGARAINRRYISDQVPAAQRTSASAAFVSWSAMGMAAGPAIAGLLNFLDFKVLGLTINSVTSPGWLMALLWIIYVVCLFLFFKEPRNNETLGQLAKQARSKSKMNGGSFSSISDSDMEQPLLLPSTSEGISERDEDEDDSVGSEPVETLSALMKEMTIPVQTLLFIYFMIKFAQEVLVSESSLVTKYYFQWDINDIGIFLAVLGSTVLPVSALVGNYVSNMFEDRIVLIWTQVMTGVGVIAILNYSPWITYTHTQYVIGAIILYVAANVTEGVNMALLSKVMSPALARGTFNCGLLSTEAGTLARVVGDGLISLTGYLGTSYILNLTMVPVLLTVFLSLFFTRWHYNKIF